MDPQPAPPGCDNSEQVAGVLQLVVQHDPGFTVGQLCTLLLLNQTCRRAVQQSVGQMKIWTWTLSTLSAFANFCSWLPAHIGLVSSIELPYNDYLVNDPGPAEQLLAFSLRESLLQTHPAAGDVGPSTRRPATQLHNVSVCFFQSAAALLPLAACSSLTHLGLSRVPAACVSTALCKALGSLCSLRSLAFSPPPDETDAVLPGCFMTAALARLQQLTKLTVKGRMPLALLQQLPTRLQELQLAVATEEQQQGPAVLQLQHLASLAGLYLILPAGVSAESQMPPSLLKLTLLGPCDALQDPPRLQQLRLYQPSKCLELLRQVQALGSLQELQVFLCACPQQELPQLFGIIGSMAQLTGLTLASHDWGLAPLVDPPNGPLGLGAFQLCTHLSTLRGLQFLAVERLDLSAEDAIELTALTAQTALRLHSTPSVNDVSLAALLCKLPCLQDLDVLGCSLESSTLWSVCGIAKQLVSLQLQEPCPDLTDAALLQLRRLTRLTSLYAESYDVSAAAHDAFEAAMPALEEFAPP